MTADATGQLTTAIDHLRLQPRPLPESALCSATRSPTYAHTFHPHFSIPAAEDAMILRAEDDTCFYTTVSLMCAHSSFFASLFADSVFRPYATGLTQSDIGAKPTPKARGTPLIELASTSSDAVRALLTLLHRTTPTLWLESLASSQPIEPFIALIDALYTLGEVYGFRGIPQLLSWRIPFAPLTALSLAARSGFDPAGMCDMDNLVSYQDPM